MPMRSDAVEAPDPDLVMHLAPKVMWTDHREALAVFIESNVTGTYNLLQAVREHVDCLVENARTTSACITSALMKCSLPGC